jgi:thermitase
VKSNLVLSIALLITFQLVFQYATGSIINTDVTLIDQTYTSTEINNQHFLNHTDPQLSKKIHPDSEKDGNTINKSKEFNESRKFPLDYPSQYWKEIDNHLNVNQSILNIEDDQIEYIVKPSNSVEDTLEKTKKLFSHHDVSTSELHEQYFQIKIPQNSLNSLLERILMDLISYEIAWIEPNIVSNITFTPNDPLYSTYQTHYSQANIPSAWDIELGNSSIKVAVLDTGIDYNHPDLQPNYLAIGYDWVNTDSNPMDDHWHGTHVAGTIAAVSNNGIGVAGIAQVSIFAEKVCDFEGLCPSTAVANGITHAADQGADVINLSLGGYTPTQVESDAIQYALSKGTIIVAAAGNDAVDDIHYPSAFTGVIAVGAVNASNTLADFSNYGEWVDIVAPGVDIASTTPSNQYGLSSGTSMACPHVSGIVGLILSKYPSYQQIDVEKAIYSTTLDLGTLGFDTIFAWGLIDTGKAIRYMQFQDLETGLNDWTTSGLWHLIDQNNPYAEIHTGTHSIWYGQDSTGDYRTGTSANSGRFTSPHIQLGNNAGNFSFWSWYRTEESGYVYDLKDVYLNVIGQGTYHLGYISGTMSTWTYYSYNISAYAGQLVSFEFLFNTTDGSGNAYRGWYMDDIRIEDKPPTITSPDDITYEYGSIDNEASWTAIDTHLNQSSYWFDETYLGSDNLKLFSAGVIITTNFDGLDLGQYNYTIVISDLFGSSISDTIFINVVETIAPIITSPDNVSYEYGSTPDPIEWIATDTYADNYDIYLDEQLNKSGFWQSGSIIQYDIDSLEVGVHNVTIIVFDSSGNNASDTVFVTVVDTSPPTVTITSPTSITYNTGSITLTYMVSDGIVMVYVDDVIQALSSGDTIVGLADGNHNVTITSEDAAVNIATATVLFSIDTTSPTILITSPIATAYSTNSVSLTYSVSDGIVTIYVDDVIQSLSSGDTISGLSDGDHNITIISMDGVGNIGTSTVLFSIDTTAPTIIITSPTVTTYNTNSVILTYSVSDGSVTVYVDEVIQSRW